jgi:hypothetical protein
MPNFGYHLARAHGNAVRRIYAATLRPRAIATRALDLPFEVYSYSGEDMLPEQVASIRSFFRYAGRPRKFTVVSDGTHSARSIALLRALSVEIAALPNESSPYLATHPTGKQLALIMSLPRKAPALYIDSDVLFFAGADLASLANGPARYLADCRLSADERLFRSEDEKKNPVNTGVLFLPEKLNWSSGMARLNELDGEPGFFTNQTVTHLTMHANGAEPFDPQKFVLQLDDQFIYRDKYASPEIALRHYVNPVRHKFWTSLWP